MNKLAICFVVLSVAIIVPDAAHAYIGPGAGLSAIGTVVAVIGTFFLLLVGFVWYPVKRLLRGRQASRESFDNGQADSEN